MLQRRVFHCGVFLGEVSFDCVCYSIMILYQVCILLWIEWCLLVNTTVMVTQQFNSLSICY